MNDSELLNGLLAPLARYCIRGSVPFSQLSESLKDILVRLACEEIERAGEKITTSRISVITGITRREVKRFFRGGGRRNKASH